MTETLVIIVEKSDCPVKKDTLWGHIHYGEDLLTTAGKDIAELEKIFLDQLQGFYNVPAENVNFDIRYHEG
jgi:hypothetical protein